MTNADRGGTTLGVRPPRFFWDPSRPLRLRERADAWRGRQRGGWLTPHRRRHIAEGVALAVVTAHNWLSNRRIPAPLYVPANLAVAATLVGIGRWGGATWAELGLDREHLTLGTATGVALSGIGAAAILAAAAAPGTGRWFADDRALLLTSSSAAYEALVRIPFGTALGEELAFRSALTALSLRQRSWPATVGWTSLLFGLWHVLPTIDTLPKHVMGRAALERGHTHHVVGFAVATTAAGGVAFSAMRWFTGSVATPALVHAVLNATALLAARRQHRS